MHERFLLHNHKYLYFEIKNQCCKTSTPDGRFPRAVNASKGNWLLEQGKVLDEDSKSLFHGF